MSTIYLVQGDTGPQIKITLTREGTGVAVDASSGTVRLKVRKAGQSDVLFTLTATDTGDNLENGICIFGLDGGDLATITPGKYDGEVEITFSNSTVETVYEKIPIVVREDF